MAEKIIQRSTEVEFGWWSMMIGLFFLAFVLYVASAGSLSKYKAWIF